MKINYRLRLILLLLTSPAIAGGLSTPKEVTANKVVQGIISFSYWSTLKTPPKICVMESAKYLLLPLNTAAGHPFEIKSIHSTEQLLTERCDAIYFGKEDAKQQTEIIQHLAGKQVLTITENNPQCVAGAAFCLTKSADRIRFSVNLDSLSRSGVKVNPDVLLISLPSDE